MNRNKTKIRPSHRPPQAFKPIRVPSPPPGAMSESELREMISEEIDKRIHVVPIDGNSPGTSANTVTEMPGGVKLEPVCPTCCNGARLKPCPACNPANPPNRDQGGTSSISVIGQQSPRSNSTVSPALAADTSGCFLTENSSPGPDLRTEMASGKATPRVEPHKRDEPTAYLPAGETRASNMTPPTSQAAALPSADAEVQALTGTIPSPERTDLTIERMRRSLEALQCPPPKMTDEQVDKVLAANGIPPAPMKSAPVMTDGDLGLPTPQKPPEPVFVTEIRYREIPAKAPPPSPPRRKQLIEDIQTLAVYIPCMILYPFYAGVAVVIFGLTVYELWPAFRPAADALARLLMG